MTPRKPALLPWLIWTLSALFVVFNYIQQVVPNVIAADLSRAFNAGAGTLGVIASTYFYAYACLQIPVGLIVDRFGVRRCLVLAILAAGFGTIGFSRVNGAGGAQLARLVMGASFAFSFIGCLKLVEEWFPASQFSTLAGMTNTAGMVGAAAGAPVAILVKNIGWRASVGGMGGCELLLAVLVLLIVRDSGKAEAASAPAAGPATGHWQAVLRNPQVWINATYATTISLVFVAFGGLWGSSYIQKVYGLSSVEAAGSTSLLFIGGIAGSLFFGWFSDFLRRRKPPMVLAGVGALGAMAGMLYLPVPLILFKAGLFAVGFFSSANIISYAVARDLFPRAAGFSIGLLSTCYYAGSATSQPLVGFFLDRASPSGLAALTPADYRFAMSPLVIFMAIGLIAALLIRETMEPAASPSDDLQPVEL